MATTLYRFRVLLDSAQHVFRDIDLPADANFQQLHEAILGAFKFSGREMASFYLSNEDWDKGQEIALMDFSEPGRGEVLTMSDTILGDIAREEGSKLLYMYDYLRMWIWYVELIKIHEVPQSTGEPEVVLIVGDAPHETSKGLVESFESDIDEDYFSEFDNEVDEGDLEGFDEELFR